MKLINYRQSIFVTIDGYNKITFEFDTIKEGATLELFGDSTLVLSRIHSVSIPETKAETYINAYLTIPNKPTTIIPLKLAPVKKTDVMVLCMCDKINTSLLLSHPNHHVFTDVLTHNENFTELVKSNNIEINAINPKTHTHHLYGEALIRPMYRIKEIKEKYKSNPQTAVLSGPSGLSTSAVTGLIDAGVKNLIILRSDYRNSKLSPDLPTFFKLHPQKHDKYLNTLIIDAENLIFNSHIKEASYEDTYLFDRISLKKTDISEIESNIEESLKTANIPVFLSRTPSYAFALCDFLESRYKNPAFRTTTPTKLMDKLVLLQKTTPDLYGEISDNTADFVLKFQSFNTTLRKAMFSLPMKETCATLRAISDKTYEFPGKSIQKGYKALEEFFSLGYNDSGKKAEKLKNECYKTEKKINPFIKTGKSGSIITLINPTPYPRDVYGMKPYHFMHFINHKQTEKPVILKNCIPLLDTKYYSISYNKSNGKIISIIDKSDMRELIDYNSCHSFCDCIFLSSTGATPSHINTDYTVQKSKNKTDINCIGIEKLSETYVKTSITFYDNSKNIDITIELTNSDSKLIEKNIIVAFPLNCENGNFFTENNNILTNELSDRIRINSNNFSVASSRAIIENKNHGFAVITPDSPIVYYGGIQYNKVSTDYNRTASSIFIHMQSKPIPNEKSEIKIRIFPYGTPNQKPLAQALDFIYPLINAPDYLTLNSKITLNNKNIILVTFKPADDGNGFILRLFEASGRKTDGSVTVPFKVSEVYYNNIIEEYSGKNTTFKKNKIEFTINSLDYTTLRIIPEAKDK